MVPFLVLINIKMFYIFEMNTKKSLYESIMKEVSKTVKKVLSEAGYGPQRATNTKIMDDYYGKQKESKNSIKESKANFTKIFCMAYNHEHDMCDEKTISIKNSIATIRDAGGDVETYVTITRNKGTKSAATAFAVHPEQVENYDGIIFMDRERNDAYVLDKSTCEMLLERPTTRFIKQTGLIKPITVKSKENADYGLILLVEIRMHAQEKYLNIH